MNLDNVILLCSEERETVAVKFYEQTVGKRPSQVMHRISNVSEQNAVVMDWGSRFVMRNEYRILARHQYLYFLFEAALIDILDEKMISSIEEQALTDKNWVLCKTINEAKIEISMIHEDRRLCSYPMELQLESTDQCNAKCVMCSHFYRNGTHSVMQQKDVITQIKQLLPYLRTVYLHGNGEPFLIPDLLGYLSVFKRYDIKFATNSNLSIVNEDIITALKDNFSELNVSCDASDKQTYEYIRQGLSFENFVKNCRVVRRECPDLKMRMMCIAMRQNIKTLPNIVRFAHEIGFNEIIFTELGTDACLENRMDTMSNYPHIANQYFKLAEIEGKACGIKVSKPELIKTSCKKSMEEEWEEFYRIELYKSKEELSMLRRKLQGNKQIAKKNFAKYNFDKLPKLIQCSFSGICDWCVQRPYIDLDGNVSVCCINQFIRVGNLFEKTFEEIWNGKELQRIRGMFYEGTLPHFCSGCEFLLQGMLSCINLKEYDAELQNRIYMQKK